MPHQLKRLTGRGDIHFITFTCYQRRKFLASPRSRNLALQILAALRQRWHFALIGYVLMPDHVHLIISEPRGCTPAKVVQVFKQRVSRKLRAKRTSAKSQLSLPFAEEALHRRFWQRRYYDSGCGLYLEPAVRMFILAANSAKSWTTCTPIQCAKGW